MRSRKSMILPLVTFCVISGQTSSNSHAEVSIDQNGRFAGILMINPEDPSPWPEYWSKFRAHVDDQLVLNQDGDERGDGEPDFMISGSTGTAEVVWAIEQNDVYQIAHSRWSGEAWSAPALLTSSTKDNLDPRLSVDEAGRLRVTWWRESSVYYRERLPDGSFAAELRVSNAGELASHPTIATSPDATFVAYEVESAGFRSVVVQKDEGGGFSPAVIAITTRQDCLGVDVREASGIVWVSWIDSDTHLGWSKLSASGWTTPSYEPYADPDDIDRARLAIRGQAIR